MHLDDSLYERERTRGRGAQEARIVLASQNMHAKAIQATQGFVLLARPFKPAMAVFKGAG